ncbi:MAG: CBS domain-containing protein [Planctomycetes bacterium]|nr:CBS domain-containing protein [Planctomycetota bacterium]
MHATLAHPADAVLTLAALQASDLMVPNPISLRAEAGVNEAMALFTEKAITAAPVIDEAGRPIGVVSRSDLLIHQQEHDPGARRANDYFYAPTFEQLDLPDENRPTGRTTVADLMTPAVFAVAPATPVSQVVNDMVGLHVHRLFVVDEAGVLVGVITTMDVLKRLRSDG